MTPDEKYDEIVKRFVEDGSRINSKCVEKMGLIETRKHLDKILKIDDTENRLSKDDRKRLIHFKLRLENDLAWQSKTKQDYKDADEFLNSFVEPTRLDILEFRINDLCDTFNEIIRKLNKRWEVYYGKKNTDSRWWTEYFNIN